MTIEINNYIYLALFEGIIRDNEKGREYNGR